MSLFRKTITVLLLPLFGGLVFAYTLGTIANQTLLRGNFVKQQLSSAGIYEVVTAELQTQVNDQLAKSGNDTSEGRDILNRLIGELDAAWLEGQVETNLDQLDGWLNDRDTLELTVDISTLKPGLRDELDALLEQRFATLPPCPAETQLRANSLAALCIPPDTNYESFRQKLIPLGLDSRSVVNTLPNAIDLLQLQGSLQPFFEKIGVAVRLDSTPLNQHLDQFRSWVLSMRSGLQMVLIGTIALLAVMLVLVALSWPTMLRWLGIILASGALLPLVIGGAGLVMAPEITVDRLNFEYTSAAAEQAVITLVQNLIRGILTPLLTTGGVLVALAVGCLILASIIRPAASDKNSKRH